MLRISTSTARELAKKYFIEKNYLESQAWFTQAILLDDKQSTEDFCTKGMIVKPDVNAVEKYFHQLSKTTKRFYEDKRFDRREYGYFTYGMLFTMLTAIILSGKNIPQFNQFIISGDDISIMVPNSTFFQKFLLGEYNTELTWIKCRDDAKIIDYANNTKYPYLALVNEDTVLYRLATFAIKCSLRLFFNFMSYCAENDILSLDNYDRVLDFIKHYKPTPENPILPNEMSILDEGQTLLQKLILTQQRNQGPLVQNIPMPSTTSILSVLQATSQPLNQPELLTDLPLSPPPPYPFEMTDTRFNEQFPPVPTHVPFLSAPPKKPTAIEELQPVYVPPTFGM
jgi:hypothetical protein